MSLREKLLAAQPKTETFVIDGDKYVVSGCRKTRRAELLEQSRGKNEKANYDKFENLLLEECVTDEGVNFLLSADEWGNAPSHISGPLVSVIMRVNGMDKQDLGKEQSDTSETQS
jgi:hypothetical protein